MSLVKAYANAIVRPTIGEFLAGFKMEDNTARAGISDIAKPCLTCRNILEGSRDTLAELREAFLKYVEREVERWHAKSYEWDPDGMPSLGYNSD